MTPADIERVFGRGRLRMVTGSHVEVFREASAPGERRRYTKRFLATPAGDFREWTEREWRLLARLVGHGIKPVPDVVKFDRGSADQPALVQTYDAGITVDHWATLLPLERDGVRYGNVFHDCAHWWALARHSLIALDAIHELRLVHLDLKADNVCIPVDAAEIDLHSTQPLRPRFDDIALIDFAFSLVSGERLATALPIAHQTDYEYQSPRLLWALEAGRRGELGPTRQLDWRCDLFSLAAMLWRYLPEQGEAPAGSWTRQRHDEAGAFVRRLMAAHDAELPATRPHAALVEAASEPLRSVELRHSLQRGWTLALDQPRTAAPATPVTRIAPPLVPATVVLARAAEPAPLDATTAATPFTQAPIGVEQSDIDARAIELQRRGRASRRRRNIGWTVGVAAVAAACVPFLGQAWMALQGDGAPVEVRAAAPIARTPAPAVRTSIPPAPALASAATPATAPAIERPVRLARLTPAPAPTPAPAVRTPSERVPAAPAAAPARAAGPAPRPPVVAVRNAPAKREPVLASRAAEPSTSGPRALQEFQARTRARLQAQVLAQAQPPVQSRDVDTPVAWAVQGKVPPAGLAAPAPTPTPAPVPTPPVTALPAAAVAAPAASAAPGTAAGPVKVASTDFAARAGDIMVEHVPRAAQRAERLVSRVLFAAARSDNAVGDDELRDAALAIGRAGSTAPIGMTVSAREAQQLGESARSEFAKRGHAAQALALQVQAFGADPMDPETAGNLAFLLLRQRAAQPEAARRLALYALTLPNASTARRIEDWATLAIASALTGRDRDARNALLVTLALAPRPDRLCKVGLDMLALYGEALRGPVEAMLASAQASGRAQSTACDGPAR